MLTVTNFSLENNIAMHYWGYASLEVKGWWGLLLPSSSSQRPSSPGTSSPPSQLKHSSAGVIWMCILRKGSTKEFFHHLNRARPTIKFSVEQAEDGAIPFLNTLLRKKRDGSLDVSVYRKPTHMNRYIHINSSTRPMWRDEWWDVSMKGAEGSSAHRTTFRSWSPS